MQRRATFGSVSTLSQDALQCSPGTLALKKKYTSAEAPDEQRETLAVSPVPSGDGDSFEFRPRIAAEKEIEMDVDEGEGETGFRDTTNSEVPLPIPTPKSETTLRSPRLSGTDDQIRFGSPFRSPHHRPQKSVFTSPTKNVPRWISVDQYNTLPQYLRSAISHERLDDAFQRFHFAQPFAQSEFLSQQQLEESDAISDKFLLQAFVKLDILVRHFSNGIMGYRLGQQWAH